MPTQYGPSGLNTAEQLFAKMLRDRGDFDRQPARQLDIISNFFEDAWKLGEWFWSEYLDEDPSLRARIGLPATCQNYREFKIWLRNGDGGGPPLRRCYFVAVGGSHYSRTQRLPHDVLREDVYWATSAANQDTKEKGVMFHKFQHTRDGCPIDRLRAQQDMDAIIAFWRRLFEKLP